MRLIPQPMSWSPRATISLIIKADESLVQDALRRTDYGLLLILLGTTNMCSVDLSHPCMETKSKTLKMDTRGFLHHRAQDVPLSSAFTVTSDPNPRSLEGPVGGAERRHLLSNIYWLKMTQGSTSTPHVSTEISQRSDCRSLILVVTEPRFLCS